MLSHPPTQAALASSLNYISDPELLRGVKSKELLKGFGAALAASPAGTQYDMSANKAETLYDKSEVVAEIDWFISHSWRDSRWAKYLSILWVQNSGVAICWANIVAALCAAIAALGVPLPHMRIVWWDNLQKLSSLCILDRVCNRFSTWLTHHMGPTRLCIFSRQVLYSPDGPRKKRTGYQSLGWLLAQNEPDVGLMGARLLRTLVVQLRVSCLVELGQRQKD